MLAGAVFVFYGLAGVTLFVTAGLVIDVKILKATKQHESDH